MRTLEQFLAHLHSLSVQLWLEETNLRFRAPSGTMTVELRNELSERKAEIISFLTAFKSEPEDQPAIRRMERPQHLPLSYAQQRLWFLNQLEEGGATYYNMPGAVRLKGVLNQPALHAALNEIVRRHEVIRTTFPVYAGKPEQQINPATAISLPLLDLCHLPPAEREERLQTIASDEAHRPFDLVHDLLLRTTLLRLAEEEHLLLVTMHHIASDGWSMAVLVEELSLLYSAYAEGKPSPLPELAIQYADFTLWQHQHLGAAKMAQQLEYWRKQLSGVPPVLELPTDHPRHASNLFRGGTANFQLDATLTEQLREVGKQQGATLFMVLQAGFSSLLARLSGQRDIWIGSPIANRNHSELEGLIGFFVNTLVLRSDLSGNPSFIELIAQSKQNALDAYAHQDLPFEQVVEALQPERNLSHSPLFQVMFALQNAPTGTLQLPGLQIESTTFDVTTARFDLTLTITETFTEGAAGLDGYWEYNGALFEAETIARFSHYLRNLLLAAVANPTQPLLQLPFLPIEEEQRLLGEWSRTVVTPPADLTLLDLLSKQALQVPDAIALEFAGQTLTYRQLEQESNRVAHCIHRLAATVGAPDEMRVGLFVDRSLELVMGLWGILKAGAAYVPLDPNYPTDRLNYMVADSQPTVIVTQSHLLNNLPNHAARIVCLDQLPADLPTTALACTISPANLAYIIYTSGSTGKPKGTMIAHGSVCNLIAAQRQTFGLQTGDRVLQFSSLSFDAATFEVLMALGSGATLVLANRDDLMPGAPLLQLLQEKAISFVTLPPSALAALPTTSLPALHTITVAGEACPADLVARWAMDRRFFNLYGPTESTIWATVADCSRQGASPKESNTPPIGRPILNTQIYVLDTDLQPVAQGVVGELYVGGDGLGRGYQSQPALTASRFVPNPFASQPGERLYQTGDLVRFTPTGDLEFLGRSDAQVKIRGFRIELGEIESVLSLHPAVREAAVVAWQRPQDQQQSQSSQQSGGQQLGKQLVAYIVWANESERENSSESSELRAYLKTRLPDYMVPALYIILPALPLTPNGKIDRRALPAPTGEERAATFVAPRSATEKKVAILWRELLAQEIGAHDDFFALGGHSLIATQLISRLRQEFQQEIPLRTLFEAPTLAEFCLRIEALRSMQISSSSLPIQPVARDQRLPLSFSQQRLWFLDQLEEAGAAYNIPLALKLSGTLNVQALQASLQEIVRRHEVLRTSFPTEAGVPYQAIAPAENFTAESFATENFALTLVDLSDLSQAEQSLRVAERQSAEAQHRFVLATGPLLTASLLRLAPHEHILLMTLHHIIADGWSLGVLVNELSLLYPAFCHHAPSPLPALTVQYADFAHWQRNWLSGAVLEEQLAYWRKQLMDAPPLLELPTDRMRPPLQSLHGSVEPFELDAELSNAIKALSQAEGVTPFMTLLSAFAVLLARYSGQDDIVIGTPIANRTRKEVEPLLGFFLNSLALRLNLDKNPSFAKVVQQARHVALDAYAHQDVPFEQLVEMLHPERNLSYSPIFQVMLILQNAPLQELTLPELTLTPMEVHTDSAKLDITLTLEESQGKLTGSWEYNRDLFDVATIQRMMAHLRNILQLVTKNPSLPIAELPILSSQEQQQMLVEWNATQMSYPTAGFVAQLFEAQVERILADSQLQAKPPVAVFCGAEAIDFLELNARANQLAQALLARGVVAGAFVGVSLPRSIDLFVALLAVFKSGAVYVPLDPGYPHERLRFMANDAQIPTLITLASLTPIFESTTFESTNFEHTPITTICLDSEREWIATLPTHNLPTPQVTLDDLAYVIYTSGSTGQPKGVKVPHRQLINRFVWMWDLYPFAADEVSCQRSALNFVDSLWELFGALLQGAPTVIIPDEVIKDTPTFIQALATAGVTRIWLVPSLLRVMLDSYPDLQERLPRLTFWVTSGEAIPKELFDRFTQQMPQAVLYNLYGTSEVWDVTWYVPDARMQQLERVPIGRPIYNMECYVLDRHLQPVPIGVYGELFVGGDGLAMGYINRPELSLERFLAHPFKAEKGARLYRTGDIVRYLADGNIEYIGRRDNQVKLRGFRIELGEVESVLLQHPALRTALVIARSDQPGEKRLVAYVVAHDGEWAQNSDTLISELRSFLRRQLPEYMVPSAFVMLDALPLTPNGKVNRQQLPAPETLQRQGEIHAPQTATERQLAAIWQEILKTPVEQALDIYDNFFDIGGHSLLVTQILSRIRSTLQIELPMRLFFQSPTIAELSQHIEQMGTGTAPTAPVTILPADRNQRLPLSFSQQRLWFLAQIDSGAAYNMPAALHLTGNLDLVALQQSFDEIVRRHEILRTVYSVTDGLPEQKILPASPVPIAIHTPDWLRQPELKDAQADTQIQGWVQQQASRAFDLANDLPIRVALLQMREDDALLFINMHHIASDGWSIGILVRELSALYQCYAQGLPSALPELPIQYADFALWQRQWLNGAVLEKQLDYWRKTLADDLPTLDLPFDHQRPALQQFRGASQSFALSAQLKESLEAVARKAGATLFMALLATFKLLLFRYTRQTDLLVGTPIANRTHDEVENMIGFFANTLVLRTQLEQGQSFYQLLQHVREVTLGAYANQDLPFEKLVETLHPARDLGRNPLFQVVFALQNAPVPDLEMPDLHVTPLAGFEIATARFDLESHIWQTAEGLVGTFIYNSELFDAPTIARLASHFCVLLEEVVRSPELPLSEFSLTIDSQQMRAMHSTNGHHENGNYENGNYENGLASVERTHLSDHLDELSDEEIESLFATMSDQLDSSIHTFVEQSEGTPVS